MMYLIKYTQCNRWGGIEFDEEETKWWIKLPRNSSVSFWTPHISALLSYSTLLRRLKKYGLEMQGVTDKEEI